jgi:hypothetical protein
MPISDAPMLDERPPRPQTRGLARQTVLDPGDGLGM